LIIIDASVLVGFLLDQEAAVTLVTDTLAADERGILHAPELIEPESLSALRGLEREVRSPPKRHRRGSPTWPMRVLCVTRTRHCGPESGSCGTTSAPTTPPTARSEQLREPLLLTGGGGLVEAAGRSLGAANVRHLPQ
jgi:hypothetical protein